MERQLMWKCPVALAVVLLGLIAASPELTEGSCEKDECTNISCYRSGGVCRGWVEFKTKTPINNARSLLSLMPDGGSPKDFDTAKSIQKVKYKNATCTAECTKAGHGNASGCEGDFDVLGEPLYQKKCTPPAPSGS